MGIKGLDNLVYLEPVEHKYFHRVSGEQYTSTSKFLNFFKKPFDPQIAYSCAGKGDYVGMTGEQVLEQWANYGKERAGKGTEIHNANELFAKTTTILPENEYLRPAILNIQSQYSGYYRVHNEVVLYDTANLLAGTSDNVFEVTSHKDSPLDLGDYKTNIKPIQQVDLDKHGKPIHKYLLHCVSHLIDSKYNFYALQLSDYAYKIERQTGRKIRKLFIHYINPENPLINYQIPLPYMRSDIINMIECYKSMAIPIQVPEPISQPKSVLSNFGTQAEEEEEDIM